MRTVAVLFLALGALLAGAPGAAIGAPRLVLSERSVDFGVIAPFEISVREVTVRNEGDAPLVLKRVRAIAAISRVLAASDTVAAGAETKVAIALNPSACDTIDTKVLIETNDSAEPALALLVHAVVVPRFVADLSTRSAGSFQPSAPPSIDIPIRFRADGGFRFVSVTAFPEFARVTAKPGADSLETIVTIGFAKGAPRGIFEGQAIVALDGARAETLRVGFYGEVVGRWRVQPFPLNTAIYQRITRRQPPVIRCERMVEPPARVLRATTDLADHLVKVETVKEGKLYRIFLVPAGGWKSGKWSGTIRITTDDPAERTIVVPATFFVE